MSRAYIIYPLLIAGLSVLLWALLNQPDRLPPWPQTVQGFSFSPMQRNNDPTQGRFPTIEEIDSDLALLQGKTHAVRSYTVSGTQGQIAHLAKQYDLNVAVGAWIGPDLEKNKQEINELLTVFSSNQRNIVRVIVGNEALLRKDVSVNQLIQYLDKTRKALNVPISTAEPWHVWLANPKLAEHVDFIAVHILPYWENLDVDYSITFIQDKMNELQAAFPNKKIVISEVGWPSRGPTRGAAKASLANQARFLRNFLEVAERQGYTYYLMEAFDQPWKSSIEGQAGDFWGVYNADRTLKFPQLEPVVRIPEWRTLAGICVAISLILISILFRDSKGLHHRGRGFLTVISFAIATGTVWIVYDFTQRYMTIGTFITGCIITLSALGIGAVVLAEAHEWAEAQWLKKYRRTPKRMLPNEYHPKVSIHVPAYNEPPEMLKETLNALSRLDYQDYEVIVIDNNTKDPNVWQPVEQHCLTLGDKFKFFHVDPISGFKAGALNFALGHTAKDAEIIAVIDSDYQVAPEWLSELVPAFEDPNMAIVQAPQDYHDGDESLYKAMINAEYQGFFHIGMVTRNERNAIIQHGTMTMVRAQVLQDMRWSEWSITEDAELGLRILAAGYDATYVPRSYGQGVMPDTFIDYKKQRFRWAYGAVVIMREHLSTLLGMNDTKLSKGQRYHFLAGWLPWLADGINLFFNLAAIFWTVLIVLFPEHFATPEALLSVLPLSFFVFKLSKMFVLYRRRVGTNWRQSIASCIAGLALSHTIGRAMVAGFVTSKIGFFRTPKLAAKNRLLKALMDCREELLFAIAMLGGVYLITRGINTGSLTHNVSLIDLYMWRLVILVQSIPFIAAVVVSLISAMPGIPAKLIEPMRPINREEHIVKK
ncbi:glycosyltransferase [Shewanella sp. SNU WT4]|uniref:glycosyltransferase n=1 Tax=Shewanella sp. SNU WT4 TaxID=2590015 RepID=UPI00112AAB93|nr:glycosyltransferase [Shewanella sp. SNU WT4]QDF66648.1 glycosyltransferase [Shewanella sp. SNU WT4]